MLSSLSYRVAARAVDDPPSLFVVDAPLGALDVACADPPCAPLDVHLALARDEGPAIAIDDVAVATLTVVASAGLASYEFARGAGVPTTAVTLLRNRAPADAVDAYRAWLLEQGFDGSFTVCAGDDGERCERDGAGNAP